MSSIGFVPGDAADQLVNVNADTIAGEIAAALGARELLFLTDVEGVRDASGAIIPELSASEARALVADGTIAGGMIPKVDACLHATRLGVAVRIVDGRKPGAAMGRSNTGTVFVP